MGQFSRGNVFDAAETLIMFPSALRPLMLMVRAYEDSTPAPIVDAACGLSHTTKRAAAAIPPFIESILIIFYDTAYSLCVFVLFSIARPLVCPALGITALPTALTARRLVWLVRLCRRLFALRLVGGCFDGCRLVEVFPSRWKIWQYGVRVRVEGVPF